MTKKYLRYILTEIQLTFYRIFRLKFYAKQNLPPVNDGYESFHLHDPGKYYFYGTYKELENFHNGLRIYRKK